MATCLITGGAGFLGSHLCDRLLAEGHRVICVDNLDTGSLENIEHIRDPRFAFVLHDMVEHLEYCPDRSTRSTTSRRRRVPSTTCACRCTRSRSARTARTTRWASPSATAHASCSPRPARSTATRRCTRSRRATGGTSTPSARAACTTRPSGTPRRSRWRTPPAGRQHQDRPDLQHLRAAHAAPRRPRDPDVPPPGDGQQADHGLRRGGPDPVVLLRHRPDRRTDPARSAATTTSPSTSATPVSTRSCSSPRRSSG